MVAQMEAAMLIKQHLESHIKLPSPLSNDPRFKLAELSVGMWMLKVSGICPEFDSPNNKNWRKFSDHYRQYAAGDLTDREDTTCFRANIKNLHSFVLERADVVVTTLTNCGDQTLIDSFRPNITFIDEAARATDLDILNAVANYQSQITILVGDDKQL